MPEVVNDGVRVGYDVVGEGRPKVLLHGWANDREWWTDAGFVDDLERDHLVVNVDLRGHGASDKPHDSSAYRKELVSSGSCPSSTTRASTASRSGGCRTAGGPPG